MSAKSHPDASSNETPSTDPVQDLQRVREILFGAQQRSTEHQLAELEQRLGNRIDAMRRELLAAIGSESSAAAQRPAGHDRRTRGGRARRTERPGDPDCTSSCRTCRPASSTATRWPTC